jgi:uncharacterized protein (DUF58 family)
MLTTGYKKFALLALLLVLVVSSQALWAQRPRLQLKEDSFNLGVLQEGEIVSHLFEFVNVGDAPLKIFDTFGD